MAGHHRWVKACMVLPLLVMGTGAASAVDPAVRLDLRVERFVAPTTGNGMGRSIPAFLGYTTNMRVEGDPQTQVLRQPAVSNTVSFPRSQWGNADEEWGWNLGISGGLFPVVMEEHADDYYLWSGIPAGSAASDDDDLGLYHLRMTRFHGYEVPHEPTGRAGSMKWRTDPAWSQTLSSTSRQHASLNVTDVGGVRSPVATEITRELYVSHAELSSTGGDVDASGGPATGPAHLFRTSVPPGTVMNLQAVSWSSAGPYGDIGFDVDFEMGQQSAPTGDHRIEAVPVLPKGQFLPEQRHSPLVASPQYTVPVTMIAAALPREAAPAEALRLVARVEPGDIRHVLVGISGADGRVQVRHLRLDEPGEYGWRVEGGRLIEEVVGASPALSSAAEAETPVEAAATAPGDGADVVLNAQGRPELRNVRMEGRLALAAYDLRRVHTPTGPVELGEANRLGRAMIWRSPSGTAQARVAYQVDGSLVVVRMSSEPAHAIATTYVETHSLDRLPHPLSVEGVADPPEDASVHDLLAGRVDRETRFLRSPVHPRLQMVLADGARFDVEPISGDAGETSVVNAGSETDGDPVADPQVVSLVQRPPIFSPSSTFTLRVWPSRDPGIRSGGFTSVKAHRIESSSCLVCTTTRSEMDDVETRDFDGWEPIALAFGAKRADGGILRIGDIKRLFVSLWTLDGRRLFEGAVSVPSFSPDGGRTWGLVLIPTAEIAPSEVRVYARAVHAGGVVAAEASPEVAWGDWGFRIDRLPLAITRSSDGIVEGETDAGADVTVGLPELGITETVRAGSDGAFRAEPDLSGAPGGDYEVVVRAATAIPDEADFGDSVDGTADGIPDDEVGTASARMRHLPGADDPILHAGDDVRVDEAAAFLAGRESGGAYDGSLRATAWAIRGLRAGGYEVPDATRPYLSSLAGNGGSAWRPGEAPSAVPSALAIQAWGALGESPPAPAAPLWRWDGGSEAAPGADVSTLEAAGLQAAALPAGQIDTFDPWWLAVLRGFLERAPQGTPAEEYARAVGLRALGAQGAIAFAGDDLDASAYSRLLGSESPRPLGSYQLLSGGFSLRPAGDAASAFPTGLALAAHAAP